MALPKINTVPEYETTIPSTGKTIRFRPFLVKEQKVLLIALESKNEKEVISAINNTILSCVKDKINIDTLTTYDTEYIFTKIRSKSVGEKTELNVKCEKCDTSNRVEVNFDEIGVTGNQPSEKTIKLNSDYSIKLRHPSYSDINKSSMQKTETQTEKFIESIVMCLDSLIGKEEIIKFKDESKKDVIEFIDNLSGSQLEPIIEFITNIPSLTYDIDFNCVKCSHKNHRTLKGLNDFF
jgi:hypothetical protein